MTQLPKHIGIIMDGNGRWAKKRNKPRFFGHENAVDSVKQAIEGCLELSIPYLTLYAFSQENFQRPRHEVRQIMKVMGKTIDEETIKNLIKKGVKILVIGDMSKLPIDLQVKLKKITQASFKQANEQIKLTLVLAISYSGRWEIVEATKKIAQDVMNGARKYHEINEDLFANYLNTKYLPDPDLIIRTSEEGRISNFLLWQMAYTEFVFAANILWPDFNKQDLYKAVEQYQKRKRKFGKLP